LEVAGQAEIQAYRALAEGLLDEYDSETLLAAALKIMTRQPEEKPLPILTEAPLIHVKSARTPKQINSGYRRTANPSRKKNHSRSPKHIQ
jgi:ATP-dependent RNA helicase DeaD